MDQRETYEAWLKQRGNVDVPPGFSDGVMEHVKRTCMKPAPRGLAASAAGGTGARLLSAVAWSLSLPLRPLAWCFARLWGAAVAAQETAVPTRNLLFRLDLASSASGYQQLAFEPGLGLLDSGGANYSILRRWLGHFAAEPEWASPSLVAFYVRDEQHRRLTEMECQLATKQDLAGPLRRSLHEMTERLRAAEPKSAAEQTLHQALGNVLAALTTDLDNSPFDGFFVKYRERSGGWQLVYCWGYQRSDKQPARAVICETPDCHRLYLCREGAEPKCPACRS